MFRAALKRQPLRAFGLERNRATHALPAAAGNAPRWDSTCQGCGRAREVETRYDHAARVLCDDCAANVHRRPRAGAIGQPLSGADDLLLHLRATGPGAYRCTQGLGRWWARCPVCGTTDALDVREAGRGVRISCELGCERLGILNALARAEAAFRSGDAEWSIVCRATERGAEIELGRLRLQRRRQRAARA